eukprot:2182108-Amphidinium_carterae.2
MELAAGIHPGWALQTASVERIDEDVEPLFDLTSPPAPLPRAGRPVVRVKAALAQREDLPSSAKHVVSETDILHAMRVPESAVAHTRLAIPMVPAEDAEHYFRASGAPWLCQQSSLMNYLLVAVDRALEEGAPLDSGFLSLAQRFLARGQTFHLSSAVVVEQETNVARRQVVQRLQRLACAIWLFMKESRVHLEKKLAESLPQVFHVLYLDLCSYDETPMVASIKSSSISRLKPTQSTTMSTFQPLHLAYLAALQDGCSFPPLAGTAKLLQIKSDFGLLFEVLDEHYLVLGETFNPVYALHRNSAANLMKCLNRSSAISSASQNFRLKVRNVVIDQGAANLLAEKVMEDERVDWQWLLKPCEVHILSTCHKKVFNTLMAEDITGMIRTSLCIGCCGKMVTWRKALEDEIKSRLVIRRGSAGPGAAAHRVGVLGVYLDKDKDALVRHMLLQSVANGDWSNTSEVQHWVPVDMPMPDSDQVAKIVTSSLMLALASHIPATYPRHRWTGAPEAITDLGLLFAIHNLVVPVWSRFCRYCGTEKPHSLASDLTTNPPVLPYSSSMHVPPHDVSADHAEDMNPDTSEGVDANHDGPSFALHNAKMRSDATSWLQTDASVLVGKMLLMRIMVAPLADMLQRQLLMAGETWETSERAKVAKAMLDPLVSDADALCRRSFRLTVAANGELEESFHNKIVNIFDSKHIWSLFTVGTARMWFRALSFKLVAKAGASVFQLVTIPHKQFPICLWKMVSDPSIGARLAAMPNCLKDPYSLRLAELFPDYAGRTCRAILLAHAHTAMTDISQIECKHASLRRTLTIGSVQTWKMGLGLCSAYWVYQSCRRHSCKKLVRVEGPQRKVTKLTHDVYAKVVSLDGMQLVLAVNSLRWFTTPKAVQLKTCRTQKKKKGHSGSYRAWVRLKSSGQRGKPDLRQLALDFHDAAIGMGDTHTYELAKSIGSCALASARKKAGSRGGFLATARQVQRMLFVEAVHVMSNKMGAMSLTEQAQEVAAFAVRHQKNANAVTIARMVSRHKQAVKNAAHETDLHFIHQFQETLGQEQLRKAHIHMPPTADHRLHPIPAGDLMALEVEYTPAVDLAVKGCAWFSGKRDCNLGKHLSHCWDEEHEVVDADSCSAAPKPQAPKKCWQLGYCICHGEGMVVHSLVSRSKKLVREHFKVGMNRHMLVNGSVFLEFTKVDACVGAASSTSQPHDQIILHISLMYLSPFRCTFMLCKEVPNPEPFLYQAGLQPMYVEAVFAQEKRQGCNCVVANFEEFALWINFW